MVVFLFMVLTVHVNTNIGVVRLGYRIETSIEGDGRRRERGQRMGGGGGMRIYKFEIPSQYLQVRCHDTF